MACEKDYSKGIIYTIKTDDGLYVGSTCDLKDRKRSHKCCIYNENRHSYNTKLYKNIRANDGDYHIEMYKPFPCNSKRELEQEEERIRIELDANLNGKRAYISAEERKEEGKEYTITYYEKNRDIILFKDKLLREKNRDKIRARRSEIITCECGSKLSRCHISTHRRTKKHLKLMKELNDF